MGNIYRLIITKDKGKYFMGKSYTNKVYKIIKNKESEQFLVGNDYHFYANIEFGFINNKLIPLSDTEAGVIQR